MTQSPIPDLTLVPLSLEQNQKKYHKDNGTHDTNMSNTACNAVPLSLNKSTQMILSIMALMTLMCLIQSVTVKN